MKHLSRSVLVLVLFLTFFFNIERLHSADYYYLVPIQGFVYILGIGVILLILTVPALRRLPEPLTLSAWLGVYLICKVFLFASVNHPLLGGYDTYISLTEACLVCLSDLLSRPLARNLDDFEQAVSHITFAGTARRIKKLSAATEDIRTEMLRSRRYKRPLSLILIRPDPVSLNATLHRTIQQVQEAMISRYVFTSLGHEISDVLRRTDMILESDKQDRFIILCPETDAAKSQVLAQRIRAKLIEKLGVASTLGIASFPDEAVTMDELIQRAETQAKDPSASSESLGRIAAAVDE